MSKILRINGEQWEVRKNGLAPSFMAAGSAIPELTEELILFEKMDGTEARGTTLPIGKYETFSNQALKELFDKAPKPGGMRMEHSCHLL
jgi:hypothetical protein